MEHMQRSDANMIREVTKGRKSSKYKRPDGWEPGKPGVDEPGILDGYDLSGGIQADQIGRWKI